MKYLLLIFSLFSSALIAKPEKGRLELSLTIEQGFECSAPRPCYNSYQTVFAPTFKLRKGYKFFDGQDWTFDFKLKEWDAKQYVLIMELTQQEKRKSYQSEMFTLELTGKFNEQLNIAHNYPELRINGAIFFATKR